MSLSHTILTKKEVQENSSWKEHLQGLKMYGDPNFSDYETNNKFPSLAEIYVSIHQAKITIENEVTELDKFKLIDGKREIIHRFDIKDDDAQSSADFTVQYPESADDNYQIKVMLGIKSDIRILFKLLASMSKICGSFFIVNPYEAYFVDKDRSYDEIWAEIQQDWNAQ